MTLQYENQAGIVPAILSPETQQAVWFLGALIHIRAGAEAKRPAGGWPSWSIRPSAAWVAPCTAITSTMRRSSCSKENYAWR